MDRIVKEREKKILRVCVLMQRDFTNMIDV